MRHPHSFPHHAGAQHLRARSGLCSTWCTRTACVHIRRTHLELRQGRRGSPGMNGANAPREARRIAEQLADVVAKHTSLEIANSYDALAVMKRTDALAHLRAWRKALRSSSDILTMRATYWSRTTK